MSTKQQGDILLFQIPDDGEINANRGIIEMDGGLPTAVYISLFGGNQGDDGRPNNDKTYWGNRDEVDPHFKYISETQYLLNSIPATSNNLNRVQQASIRDLQWLIVVGAASSLDSNVSIPALNRIKIIIKVEADGEESEFEFSENWVLN